MDYPALTVMHDIRNISQCDKIKQKQIKLGKVAIVMHWNLKPPVITLVVLTLSDT